MRDLLTGGLGELRHEPTGKRIRAILDGSEVYTCPRPQWPGAPIGSAAPGRSAARGGSSATARSSRARPRSPHACRQP